ncbi:MAG: hypothetical protein ACRCXL_13630 [Dermatophilaceae bacterium]
MRPTGHEAAKRRPSSDAAPSPGRGATTAAGGGRPNQEARCSAGASPAAVSATGAASGGAAAVPGIGTPAALALALGDAAGFAGIAVLYVLSLAEIHDLPVTELERRRTLLLGVLLGVLLGDAGAKSVQKVAARTGPGGTGGGLWSMPFPYSHFDRSDIHVSDPIRESDHTDADVHAAADADAAVDVRADSLASLSSQQSRVADLEVFEARTRCVGRRGRTQPRSGTVVP